MKFTEKGNIFVILNDFDEFTISIEVLDSGSGIAEEK